MILIVLGRTYRFRVLAYYSNNDIRRSPSSAKFSLVAGQLSVPVTAPTVVEARALSTSEIFIGWQVAYHCHLVIYLQFILN